MLITHICIPSAKLNVVVNNLATIMNTILLLPYPLRILFGPLPIEVDIFCLLTSVYFPALSGGDRGLLQHPPGPHPDNKPPHSKDCPHDTLHLAL